MNKTTKNQAREVTSKVIKHSLKLATKLAALKGIQEGLISPAEAKDLEFVVDLASDIFPAMFNNQSKMAAIETTGVEIKEAGNSVRKFGLVEKETGTLWSRTTDVVPQTQKFKFKGKLVAEVEFRSMKAVWLEELYLLETNQYQGDCYIVYTWTAHHMDYATATMSCMDCDTILPPLTATGIQQNYPALATNAGMSLVIEYG